MGTWGSGIFDSDTGLDIRGDFRDMMGDEVPVEEAVAKLIEEHDPDDCVEEAAEFWFALALAQIQTGRLTELVKKRALELIASGGGLEAFARDCPEELPARKRAIQRLEKKILGPQKKPTKIKKAFVDTIEWESGDGLAYQLPSGMWTGLKVRDVTRDPKDSEALYEVADIYQESMPTAEEMQNAAIHLNHYSKADLADLQTRREELRLLRKKKSFWPRKTNDDHWGPALKKQWCHAMGHSVFQLYRLGPREKPGGKVVKICEGLEWEKYTDLGGTVFGGWKDLDDYLERDHGLK